MGAVRLKLLDDGEPVADRAVQAVEPHDQGLAGQQAGQYRPTAVHAGGDGRATGGRAVRGAADRALLLGRDVRTADQAAWRGGFLRLSGVALGIKRCE
jgi:hypothetical protein